MSLYVLALLIALDLLTGRIWAPVVVVQKHTAGECYYGELQVYVRCDSTK